jgi:hypothetical protein
LSLLCGRPLSYEPASHTVVSYLIASSDFVHGIIGLNKKLVLSHLFNLYTLRDRNLILRAYLFPFVACYHLQTKIVLIKSRIVSIILRSFGSHQGSFGSYLGSGIIRTEQTNRFCRISSIFICYEIEIESYEVTSLSLQLRITFQRGSFPSYQGSFGLSRDHSHRIYDRFNHIWIV